MCDERTIRETNARRQRSPSLSRREFGALSLGAGLALSLPRAANAVEVTAAEIDVPTPDGMADCYFVHPTSGVHPGVVIWPDARGMRAAYRQMAARLAESGYAVAAINPYYRNQRAPVLREGAAVEDPGVLDTLRPLMQSLSAQTHVTDATALVEFLDGHAAVDTGRKTGHMGYCMGGPIVMRAAAALPERVGACASFHGAGLVTDRPDSPHLLVPQMQAAFLFAIAEGDDAQDPDAKTVLRESFDAAGKSAEIEVYEGTLHGWCPPGNGAYHEAQAERAWSRLLALFERALA
jgi:carboxymethylenebutenolidase